MSRLIPLVFAVAMLIPWTVIGSGRQESRFVVYYTASLNGNLDGCTCVSRPRAGLVKRAAYLRSLPDRDFAILVDVGDFLDTLPDDLMPGIVLQTYTELGYAAVAVGDQELVNGAKALLSLREAGPVISNNLVLCPTPDACHIYSSAPIIVRTPWGTAGICSLINSDTFALHREETRAVVKVADPEETAKMLTKRLDGEGVTLSILLYHGSPEGAKRLATEVPGFDVIVVGHDQYLLEPVRSGDSLLVSPGEEGNRVGRLEITRTHSGTFSYRNSYRLFSYMNDPDDLPTRTRIDWYLETLKARLKKQ
jgi:2',3'-cyclic-nucleotide 2'-phosphodiesterase (5'-nucleotidase family)